MSIPNEALQKLLLEIEQKAAVSQQQIAIVKAQIAAKSREHRLLQLMKNELESLPKETRVYEGVGKMFMLSPMDELKDKCTAQSTELQSDKSNLDKKMHYLETTAKNSQSHIEQLLRSGGKA